MKNSGIFVLASTVLLVVGAGLGPSWKGKTPAPIAEESDPITGIGGGGMGGGEANNAGTGTGSGTGTGASPVGEDSTLDPNMPGGAPGSGSGLDREWRGYVATDVEALRSQLPDSAKHLAGSFVEAGQKYNMDPLFLVSISKLETANWTSNAFINRGNAMGISNAAGVVNQSSARQSIMNQAASLAGAPGTGGYYNAANTVGQVGPIYAPVNAANDINGTNGTWATLVGANYNQYSNAIRR